MLVRLSQSLYLIIQRIKSGVIFQEKGYLNATVDIKQKPDTSEFNSMIFDIYIEKGEKIKIASINIYGNEDVDLSQFDSKFKRKMKTLLSILLFIR